MLTKKQFDVLVQIEKRGFAALEELSQSVGMSFSVVKKIYKQLLEYGKSCDFGSGIWLASYADYTEHAETIGAYQRCSHYRYFAGCAIICRNRRDIYRARISGRTV